MTNSSLALGFFDSGVGGLAVVKKLLEILPNESICYLADTLNLPYGNKSASDLNRLCAENFNFLITKPLKALVIACNTAMAYSYENLHHCFSIPVFDAVTPTVKEACLKTKSGKIAILATDATVRSNLYEKLLREKLPFCEVLSIACPLLASAIEEKFLEQKLVHLLIKQYLAPLKNADIDTLIVGCTHYSLVIDELLEEMDKPIEIVDSSTCLAEQVAQYLKRHDLTAESDQSIHSQYYVTGALDKFSHSATKILNQEIVSQKK